ncbi:STAS domain-containing protein [Aquisediminimonas sediminicola]|uniref:STAS domain-containing protein n=1 Tax=Alteraquisediminimonas sediminicola TaxID=2676787 RepID=UPI001C8F04A2|nr:STAS domain-containing protein [Aquisediminimonas sediminicola]
MEVTSELVGNVHIVTLNGELDASNVNYFKEMVLPLLTSPIKLLIDLSGIRFIDSSGMGAMISCQRHAAAVGGRLKLCGLSPVVRAAFELLRLQAILDINNTREEALQSFA